MRILSVKNRNGVLPRDDYRQLAETSLMLLGGTPPGGVNWKKPGAVHKARFMSNSLYSNVMYAFQDVLDYDADTIAELRRFVVFNVLIYAPHFLSASVGSDSPYNDLKLFKLLSKFRTIDGDLSDTALNVLRRHLWYLTEEVVVFSLFSGKLFSDEKSRIAAKLLTFSVPDHIECGKPEFPDLLEKTQLVDLIGPKSWFLFLKLKVGYEWLQKNVELWKDDPDFQTLENFVRTVKTTNDTAERAVKLITDYAQILTKDENMRQWILQAVDENRKKFPEFKKKILNNVD